MHETQKERFYGKIVETNGVLRITIPKDMAEAANYNAGDKVAITISKVE